MAVRKSIGLDDDGWPRLSVVAGDGDRDHDHVTPAHRYRIRRPPRSTSALLPRPPDRDGRPAWQSAGGRPSNEHRGRPGATHVVHGHAAAVASLSSFPPVPPCAPPSRTGSVPLYARHRHPPPT